MSFKNICYPNNLPKLYGRKQGLTKEGWLPIQVGQRHHVHNLNCVKLMIPIYSSFKPCTLMLDPFYHKIFILFNTRGMSLIVFPNYVELRFLSNKKQESVESQMVCLLLVSIRCTVTKSWIRSWVIRHGIYEVENHFTWTFQDILLIQ